MEDRHLSLSDVAGLMGVSERTVRRWIHSGKLKAYKPGRDYRIPESAVRELVEESEVYPKEPRRSSLELSLFNGNDERPSVVVDGMVGLLERWHARRLAEVEDPASPHFRDPTSAVLWIADTREEANHFRQFLSEWGTEHASAFKTLLDALYLFAGALVLDSPAKLGEMRLDEMTDKPDELAVRRMERATAEAQASMEQLQELGKAANG